MSIKDVMAYLKSLDSAPAEPAATPATPVQPLQPRATPEKTMGLQEKPIQIKAVSPATPATPKNTDSRVNFPAFQLSGVLENPSPDSGCWPHGTAMNMAEIEAFTQRSGVFSRRGMPSVQAEELAYRLVNRDREEDDRRLCLECAHLEGFQPGLLSRSGWRCNQWQRAGMGAAGVPAGLVLVLQRCDGFKPTR